MKASSGIGWSVLRMSAIHDTHRSTSGGRFFIFDDVHGFGLIVITKCWMYVKVWQLWSPHNLYQLVQIVAEGLLGSALIP